MRLKLAVYDDEGPLLPARLFGQGGGVDICALALHNI